MKQVLHIFTEDIKAILRNPIALIVTLALLVLPGLYAWYCILANWSPYSNTGNVPVIVVNNDKGATSSLAGELDIGKQVIEKLADNDKIKWEIYDDEEEARLHVERGDAYAMIVIPEDLSKNIAGIFEGSDKQPQVLYYPNQRYSAVATKVTDSAAQTLVKSMNQAFASTVNAKLVDTVGQGVDKIEAGAERARSTLGGEVAIVQSDISAVITDLDEAATSIDNWRSTVASAQAELANASNELPVIRQSLDNGSAQLEALQAQTAEFEASFASALASTNQQITSLSTKATELLSRATGELSSISGDINSLSAQLRSFVSDTLPKLSDLAKELGLTDLETRINDLTTKLNSILGSLESASQTLKDAMDGANTRIKNLDSAVQKATASANSALNILTSQIIPKLSSATQSLASALSSLSGALGQFQPQIEELQAVLVSTDTALAQALDATTQAKTLLTGVSTSLTNTVTDLNSLRSALQIETVAGLLKVDKENVGSFLSTPVNIVTEKIYPVSNYGSGVAPFYTNLALWVGCFILITVFRLEVDRKRARGATTTQRYFGRWLTLTVFALIQSQVICGVDILLGIDCAEPVAFMVAGAICSFVYMNLIFALAITLRNIGKTIIILLLIMQVPGSSGMYPIEIMPGFFQGIHPLLPFTYGIDAMREALCGMYGLTYLSSLAMLLIVVPISLLIGVVLRPRMMNLTNLFDSELSKAGFFAGEEHGQKAATSGLRKFMRLFSSSDTYRDSFEERSWRFKRRYPKQRQIGAVAFFAIPIAFLVLMLPINLIVTLPTDVKLNVMLVMVILLIIAQFSMVLLEYANRTIEDEARLLGAELMADFFDDDQLMAAMAPFGDRAGENGNENEGDGNADCVDGAAGPDGAGSGFAGIKPAVEEKQPRSRMSGPASEIFRTDFRLGFQSIIGAVVIVLLVVTPSLYAWFNLAGSWDPYSATGGLRIAVSNEDEGYKGDILPITINVGDTVISGLRANSNFDWQFVDTEDALTGIQAGDYYASIVIPSGFTRSMMTYLSGESSHPNVIYYTNEKENPIAPLITQKGADAIQENIREAFTARVDEVGILLATNLIDFTNNPQVKSFVENLSNHLDDAIGNMQAGGTELRLIGGLSSMVSGIITTARSAFDGILTATDAGVASLDILRTGAQDAEAAFSETAALLDQAFAESGGSLDALAADIDEALAGLQNAVASSPSTLYSLSAEVDQTLAQVDAMRGIVEAFRDTLKPDDPLYEKATTVITNLNVAGTSLADIRNQLNSVAANADPAASSIGEMRTQIQQLLAEVKQGLSDAKSFYDNTVATAIGNLKASFADASNAATSIFDGLRTTLGGISGNTSGLSSTLDKLASRLDGTGDKLSTSAQNLANAKNRLTTALASGDMTQITKLLADADAAELAERLAAPIEEKIEPLYPVANFGSSMASFYTVLSLWVGALVMVSTMKARLTPARTAELRKRFNLKPRHEYLGRFGIFAVVGLAQSLLVCLGDLCLLHIQCVHPVLFVLMGVFIGQVFVLIVYTLTELFGDVGKAVCVILLIMQVAASGGTFPIEMLDPFFQTIAPFLPFYHGMTAMQGCVAGMFNGDSFVHLGYLLVYVAGTLLIGIVARKPFRKLTDWVEVQLEKTEFM